MNRRQIIIIAVVAVVGLIMVSTCHRRNSDDTMKGADRSHSTNTQAVSTNSTASTTNQAGATNARRDMSFVRNLPAELHHLSDEIQISIASIVQETEAEVHALDMKVRNTVNRDMSSMEKRLVDETDKAKASEIAKEIALARNAAEKEKLLAEQKAIEIRIQAQERIHSILNATN
ncbi:MAG: hypothetical protein ATN35_05745 [Epulopiscium sp. Nele67-Bin004]|nr:MAG: hypothetical protein ATN35_05745 [Epulopiscium sp. Nele67-Bin004]